MPFTVPSSRTPSRILPPVLFARAAGSQRARVGRRRSRSEAGGRPDSRRHAPSRRPWKRIPPPKCKVPRPAGVFIGRGSRTRGHDPLTEFPGTTIRRALSTAATGSSPRQRPTWHICSRSPILSRVWCGSLASRNSCATLPSPVAPRSRSLRPVDGSLDELLLDAGGERSA